MDANFINPLAGEPDQEYAFFTKEGGFSVPARVSGVGYGAARSDYSWRGLSRSDHRGVVLQWTLEGAGALQFESETYSLGPGDLFVVSIPHDHHYFRPKESNKWKFLYFTIEGPAVGEVKDYVHRLHGPVHRILPKSQFGSVALDCFRRVPVRPTTEFFESSRMAWALLMSLCSTLAAMGNDVPASITRPALQLIYGAFQRDLSIEEMAQACGVTRHHFGRVFRRENGIPPGRYLERVRMRRAAQLLLGGGLPVPVIAEECGYRDSGYFNKVFRRTYGVTSGEFRRRGR